MNLIVSSFDLFVFFPVFFPVLGKKQKKAGENALQRALRSTTKLKTRICFRHNQIQKNPESKLKSNYLKMTEFTAFTDLLGDKLLTKGSRKFLAYYNLQ